MPRQSTTSAPINGYASALPPPSLSVGDQEAMVASTRRGRRESKLLSAEAPAFVPAYFAGASSTSSPVDEGLPPCTVPSRPMTPVDSPLLEHGEEAEALDEGVVMPSPRPRPPAGVSRHHSHPPTPTHYRHEPHNWDVYARPPTYGAAYHDAPPTPPPPGTLPHGSVMTVTNVFHYDASLDAWQQVARHDALRAPPPPNFESYRPSCPEPTAVPSVDRVETATGDDSGSCTPGVLPSQPHPSSGGREPPSQGDRRDDAEVSQPARVVPSARALRPARRGRRVEDAPSGGEDRGALSSNAGAQPQPAPRAPQPATPKAGPAAAAAASYAAIASRTPSGSHASSTPSHQPVTSSSNATRSSSEDAREPVPPGAVRVRGASGRKFVRWDYVPPEAFYTRRVPHNLEPIPGVEVGAFSGEPHLRVGGICGEVHPLALAHAIRAISGVTVAAVHNFRPFHGLAIVRLHRPEVESRIVQIALHQTAWMSQTAVYWITRGAVDGDSPQHNAQLLALATQRLNLACFAGTLVSGCRLPSRLMTCEPWSRDAPARAEWC